MTNRLDLKILNDQEIELISETSIADDRDKEVKDRALKKDKYSILSANTLNIDMPMPSSSNRLSEKAVTSNILGSEKDLSLNSKTKQWIEKSNRVIQKFWKTNYWIRLSLFLLITGTIFADQVSTFISIKEYFEKESQRDFGTITLVIVIVNYAIRFIYNYFRVKEILFAVEDLRGPLEEKIQLTREKIKLKKSPCRMRLKLIKLALKKAFLPLYHLFYYNQKFFRYFDPLLQLDILIPQYMKIVAVNKTMEESFEIQENIFDIGVLSLSTDNIPQACITLYSQITENQLNAKIMFSCITSLFSLARNMNEFIYNPFKSSDEQTNNKRGGYQATNILETLVELWNTYIELIYRICILCVFAYISRPYGAWLYFSWVGLFYLGYVLGIGKDKRIIQIIFHYISGLLLVVIHSKASRFIHPITNYEPIKDEETKNFHFKGLSWLDYKIVNLWRVFQLITTVGPLIYIFVSLGSELFDRIDFTKIVLYIGVLAFGYMIFINYIPDTVFIFLKKKNLKTWFLRESRNILEFSNFLIRYPYITGELGKIASIIRIMPVLIKKFPNIIEKNVVRSDNKKEKTKEKRKETVTEAIYNYFAKDEVEITPEQIISYCNLRFLEQVENGHPKIIYNPNKDTENVSIEIAKLLDAKANYIRFLELDFKEKIIPIQIISSLSSFKKRKPLESLKKLVLKGAQMISSEQFKLLIQSRELKDFTLMGSNNKDAFETIFQMNILNIENLQDLVLDLSNIRMGEKESELLINLLQNNKLLENLSLNLKNTQSSFSAIDEIFRIIQNLEKLKSLELNFSKNSNLQSSHFRYFLNKRQLNRLCLDLEECRFDEDMVFEYINQIELDTLQECRFNISDGKFNIAHYTNFLKKSRSLASLGFCFKNILQKIDPEDLIEFFRSFSNKNQLSSLALDFENCQFVNENCLMILSQSLSSLFLISSFKLNLINCRNINKGRVENYLFESFSRMKHSKDFELEIFNDSDLELHPLNRGNTHIQTNKNYYLWNKKLSSFKLKLFQPLNKKIWEVDDILLEELKIMDLGLVECSNGFFENIVEILKFTCNLKSLKANFSNSMINDLKFQNFVESIANNINLEQLHLNFGKNKELTDYSLKGLSQFLQHLQNLDFLDLNFESCGDISDEGIKDFAKSIKRLPFLEAMTLNIANNKRITNFGMQKLNKSLRNLKTLSSLDINLSDCLGINETGFIQIDDCIANLKSLTCLELKFSNTTIQNSLLKLADSLIRLPMLNQIYLDLENCTSSIIQLMDLLFLLKDLILKKFGLNISGINFPKDSISQIIDKMKSITCTEFDLKVDLDIMWTDDFPKVVQGIIRLDQSNFLIKISGIHLYLKYNFIELDLRRFESIDYPHLERLIKSLQIENLDLRIYLPPSFPKISTRESLDLYLNYDKFGSFDITTKNEELSNSIIDEARFLVKEKKLNFGMFKINNFAILSHAQPLNLSGTSDLVYMDNMDERNELSKFCNNHIKGEKIINFEHYYAKSLANVLNFVKNMNNLKHLFINVEIHTIGETSPEFLEKLHLLIDNLSKSTQWVKIQFKTDEFFDSQALKKSADSLDKCDLLEYFYLDLGSIKNISSSLLKILGDSIINLTTDYHYHMNLSKFKDLDEKRSKEVLEMISFRNNLQYFYANFGANFEIRDSLIIDLTKRLSKLTYLQHFQIKLSHNKGINNSSFIEFSAAIQNFTQIQVIDFEIEYCSEINDTGLEEFSNAIKQLNSIKTLKLNLSQLTGISYHCFKDLFLSLEKLEHLETIYFELKESKIDLEALRTVFIISSKLNYLDVAYIEFDQDDDISLEKWEELENDFPDLFYKMDILLPKIKRVASYHALRRLNKILAKSENMTRLHLDFYNYKIFSKEDFSTLFKDIVKNPKLSELVLNFKECSNFEGTVMDQFISSISQLSHLSLLELNFSNTQIDNEQILNFSACLPKLNLLKILSLNFEKCKPVLDNSFEKLFSGLLQLIHLNSLALNFGDSFNGTNKGLEILSKGLSQLTGLNKLSLNFDSCEKFSDASLESISKGFIQLNLLNKLDLYVSSKLIGSGIKHIDKNFVNLSLLSNLNLSFRKCEGITDYGIKKLSLALSQLLRLNSLNLDFYGCSKIKDKGLEKISACLWNLNQLNRLTLNLNNCFKITDSGFKKISSVLSSLSQLQHLSIDLSHCKEISDDGLAHLSGSLSNLTRLTNFKFNCEKLTSLSNIEKISFALPQLQLLKELKLRFCDCKELLELGVEKFSENLCKFARLSHLSLNFKSCDKLNDKVVEFISINLAKLGELSKLHLNFDSCKKIGDPGIEKIALNLSVLSNLSRLKLNFTASKITSRVLQKLAASVSEIKLLNKLNLNFSYCKDVDDKGLETISSSLFNLTLLNKLTLNFTDCHQLSDKGLEILTLTTKAFK